MKSTKNLIRYLNDFYLKLRHLWYNSNTFSIFSHNLNIGITKILIPYSSGLDEPTNWFWIEPLFLFALSYYYFEFVQGARAECISHQARKQTKCMNSTVLKSVISIALNLYISSISYSRTNLAFRYLVIWSEYF